MTTKQIVNNLTSELIGASAPQMKAEQATTTDWAEWLRLSLHNDPEIERLAKSCGAFATAFNNGHSPRWLAILGSSGTGKTHCARRLWRHLSNRKDWTGANYFHSEIYWPEFVGQLRSGNAFERYRDMMKWPVLFLDDIGAERDTSGFASEQLSTLIGCREGRWTILTSNLTLGQLGAIDPRISDRIIRQPNIFIEIKTKSHSLRVLKGEA
jgi:DNA replication protein DnaC